jgi:hypothetical protein
MLVFSRTVEIEARRNFAYRSPSVLNQTSQVVSKGLVYRRIPPFPNYFDHDRGRPERVAFQPRRQDNKALSADLDKDTAYEALKSLDGFGLCSLEIERITDVTSGRVVVNKTGVSHVRLENCDDEQIQLLLVQIAVVLVAPGKS